MAVPFIPSNVATVKGEIVVFPNSTMNTATSRLMSRINTIILSLDCKLLSKCKVDFEVFRLIKFGLV